MAPESIIEKECSTEAYRLSLYRRATHLFAKSRSLLALTLFALWWWSWWASKTISQSLHSESRKSPTAFSWDQIEPSEHLVYRDCWDGKQCARLQVPMDWNDTESKTKVNIAIVKLPAKVHVTDPRYGGPILVNPGGPGGSGVNMLLAEGHIVQGMVDASTDVLSIPSAAGEPIPKYYDIVGFDPRGVNNTTPILACFPSAYERLAWNLQSNADGLLGMFPGSFERIWARAQALGKSCAEQGGLSGLQSEKNIGEFINTTPVVRDMLEIVEKSGEWRESQARQWLSKRANGRNCVKASGDTIEAFSEKSVLERTKWIRGDEKLIYWGFSYGTILGTTFAAMYPSRIGRVILDGVVDAPDWYNSSRLSALDDSDRALDRLFQLCFESGSSEKCALYDPRGADEIKSRFFSIFESLKENPVAFVSPKDGPQIITASDVDNAFHLALYFPLETAEQFFQALHDLSNGDGTWFANFKRDSMTSSIINVPKKCADAPPWTPECQNSVPLDSIGSLGVECSDGLGDLDRSPEGFKEYWGFMRNVSWTMGSRRASDRLRCTHWKLRPKWKFTGPFEGNTSHPILFIGNSLDPTTPLNNARKAAASFQRAVVLQNDAIGHCSSAAPSSCTTEYVRRYFQTGELPGENTSCEVEEVPFLGKVSKIYSTTST